MALDKKQIALTVGGILAGLTLTYLLYRLEQNNAATASANAANAAAEEQSELSNQQADVASLPSVSVPTISSTPSTTDTTNQATAPASSSALEAILASMLGEDTSGVTSQTSPTGNAFASPIDYSSSSSSNKGTASPPSSSSTSIQPLAALPAPTASSLPTVTIPTLMNFGGNPAQPTPLNTNIAKGT